MRLYQGDERERERECVCVCVYARARPYSRVRVCDVCGCTCVVVPRMHACVCMFDAVCARLCGTFKFNYKALYNGPAMTLYIYIYTTADL